jgi:hypothetical protein
MHTITMTWEEFRSICNLNNFAYCRKRTGRTCTVKSTCPIWKRADRRQVKAIRQYRRELEKLNKSIAEYRKPLVFVPVPTVVEGKLKPGKKYVMLAK